MGQVAHTFDPGERIRGIWGTRSVILTLTALHSGVAIRAVWQTRVLFAPLAVRLPLESPRGLCVLCKNFSSKKNQDFFLNPLRYSHELWVCAVLYKQDARHTHPAYGSMYRCMLIQSIVPSICNGAAKTVIQLPTTSLSPLRFSPVSAKSIHQMRL